MNGEMMTARAEKRVKEKSSYRKLITNLQETYPELSQDQALRGILALRAENSGTLTGMTMLEIMEGVVKIMKSVKTEYHLDNSDDADAENSSVEDSERPLKTDSDGDDIIVDIESTGSPEDIHETPKIPATMIQKKGAATGSTGDADSTDYYEDDSEDESYNPATSKTSPRKKKTTLRKSPIKEGIERSAPKSRGVRKKQEKIELSVEDIEAEFPKICRKRKFPSHLNEYTLPYPEEEADVDVKSKDDEDDLFKISPKPKNVKKKKAETDKNVTPPSVTDEINESSFVNGVNDKSTVEKLPRKKNIVKQLSAPKFGICGLCGISFDESSKKVNITEKTRETGQPFADVLQRLCREEKLPSSVTDINFDSGLLCTLCVSYIDQLDVFQQKLTEIKSSIIKVLMRNGKDENSHNKSDSEEIEGTEEVVLPKKRGRPPKPKSGKMVTLVYQSPLQEPKAVPTPSPDKSVSVTSSPTDGNIAHKLSVLSGIEIKRINTETGEETDARLDLAVTGQTADKDVKVRKKRSPNKKKIPALQVTDKNFEDACQSLEDELVDDPPVAFEDESVEDGKEADGLSQSLPPTEPPVCPPARGRGRGRGRGRPILSQRPPPPPLQKSRKSLFESSQERRRSGTPLMTPSPSPCPPLPVHGLHLTPATSVNTAPAATSAKLYSVPVAPLLSPAAASTPLKREATPEAELKQKKAYRKLVARIRGAHPEISSEEALRGVVAVRAANQGTLTGMSMQEIIAKVRESVLEAAAASSVDSVVPPIGEEFERMVNAPLPVIESPEIEQQKYFELKCQFCSRLFKSSSESATRKVYEIHMHEHDLENRNIYQECSADDKLPVKGNTDTEAHDSTNHTTESQKLEKENVPCDLKCDPDPVRSESSYCKLCHKQFKNSKLYGIHQNSEHAAEKEFEKISNAS